LVISFLSGIFRYSPNESTHGYECQAFSEDEDSVHAEKVELWDNGLFVHIDPSFCKIGKILNTSDTLICLNAKHML